jgi:hypothetical protein
MDIKHKADLVTGARVAVYMGATVAEVFGTPPIVTTATVIQEPDGNNHVWLATDVAQGQTLPQCYSIQEILGFMLPMALIEEHPDGSTTGTFPKGTVGP